MTANLVKNLEMWPLERLAISEDNPRTHSSEQVAQIAASITEFGFNNPILADGDSVIIAGHARFLAARRLGLTQVPVVVLEHLTPLQKRAYMIADNKLALNAGWDEELLKSELMALEQDGLDPHLTGFSDDELAAILGSLEEPQPEPPLPSHPPLPVSRPGDLWTIGEHRILCGDATQPDALDRVLQGETAGMVFTDPPYNVDYQQSNGRRIQNDRLGSRFEQFLSAACLAMLRVTEGAIYICMSSSELHTLQRAFVNAGGHWSTFLIWAKNTFTLGHADYQRQFEPILYGWREGATHYWCGDRDQGDVWFFDKPLVNDLHPTMKPVELVERAIFNSSRPKAFILDPFAGSGTTLAACHNLGRRSRLIELDPGYVDVIVQRAERLLSKPARLEGDSRSFTEIAADRTMQGAQVREALHE